MEEEEKQKSEEKPDEEQKDVNNETDNDKNVCKEPDCIQKEAVAEREDDIETTEYDISTDDESLRMIFSSTDQVIQDKYITIYSSMFQSNCCSELCSRRSSMGSYPALHNQGHHTHHTDTSITLYMVVCSRQGGCEADECDGQCQGEARSRSQEDVSKMRLIQRRRNLLTANQSVSLDHGDTG